MVEEKHQMLSMQTFDRMLETDMFRVQRNVWVNLQDRGAPS